MLENFSIVDNNLSRIYLRLLENFGHTGVRGFRACSTHTHTQTDRQTDRQTNRHKDESSIMYKMHDFETSFATLLRKRFQMYSGLYCVCHYNL